MIKPKSVIPLIISSVDWGWIRPEGSSNYITPGGSLEDSSTYYEMYYYKRNKVYFKNYNGKYVSVTSDFAKLAAAKDTLDETCYFDLFFDDNGGTVLLKGYNGQYVSRISGLPGEANNHMCASKANPDYWCNLYFLTIERRPIQNDVLAWNDLMHKEIFRRAIDTIDYHKSKIHFAPETVTLMRQHQVKIEEGIRDADYKLEYTRFAYAGHFYDPDTGNNYLVDRWPVIPIYTTTALDNASDFYEKSVKSSDPCYFGLAIHFLCDILCPIHAANFIQFNDRIFLDRRHSGFEAYADANAGKYFRPPASISPDDIDPDKYENPISTLQVCARASKDVYTKYLAEVIKAKQKGPFSFENEWKASEADPALNAIIPYAQEVISLLLLYWAINTNG